MRNLFVFHLIIVFFIICCSKTEHDDQFFERIAKDLNGELLSHNVSIIDKTKDNQIGIIILNKNGHNIGERCFILIFETDEDKRFLTGHNFQVDIIYFNEGLIIRQIGSRDIYYLGLDDYSSTFWINTLKSSYNIDFENILLGYSISSHQRVIEVPDELPSIRSIYDLFTDLNISETAIDTHDLKGTNCSSGGPGSSSCSIEDVWSGCSVSCKDGYYACCESGKNVCRCVKERQSLPTK
ncbi:MAG TPA: hypothetical protein VJ203_06705 [Bacteroidales bacterium]|nr:hypothetical protein [Bacteroidales bacterium]